MRLSDVLLCTASRRGAVPAAWGLVAWVLALCTGPVAATQGCGAAEGWVSVDFAGEAYGEHDYETQLGAFVFVLEHREFGWHIQVRDAGGRDLAVFSPPARPVEANPLNIAGWHFRNLDNTAPNRGEVNAPQGLRQFVFGRLATDPMLNPALIAPAEPDPASPAAVLERADAVAAPAGGRGELVIEDFGLADLEPQRRARMVYMKFHGCLEWDPGPRAETLADTAAPGIVAPVVGQMQACGLDASVYRLSDRMIGGREGGQNPYLEPDLDGDGQRDLVVPVTRRADGAPGLAMCLAAERRVTLAGFSGRIGRHLDPTYFGRVDWWNVVTRGPVGAGVSEGPPPRLRGDAIVLGKEDSSSVLVFLDADGKVTSYWQGD